MMRRTWRREGVLLAAAILWLSVAMLSAGPAGGRGRLSGPRLPVPSKVGGPKVTGRIVKGRPAPAPLLSLKTARPMAPVQALRIRPLRESLATLKGIAGAEDQAQRVEASSGPAGTLMVTPRNPVAVSGELGARLTLFGAWFSPDPYRMLFADAYRDDVVPLFRRDGFASVFLGVPEGWYVVEAQFYPNNVTAEGKMTATVSGPDPFEAEFNYEWVGEGPIGLVYFPVVVHVGNQSAYATFTCTDGDATFRGVTVERLR